MQKRAWETHKENQGNRKAGTAKNAAIFGESNQNI